MDTCFDKKAGHLQDIIWCILNPTDSEPLTHYAGI